MALVWSKKLETFQHQCCILVWHSHDAQLGHANTNEDPCAVSFALLPMSSRSLVDVPRPDSRHSWNRCLSGMPRPSLGLSCTYVIATKRSAVSEATVNFKCQNMRTSRWSFAFGFPFNNGSRTLKTQRVVVPLASLWPFSCVLQPCQGSLCVRRLAAPGKEAERGGIMVRGNKEPNLGQVQLATV